jgi:hypothetical protein
MNDLNVAAHVSPSDATFPEKLESDGTGAGISIVTGEFLRFSIGSGIFTL